nr:DEAD/DEAH box helicase family protein [Sedimentibacter sp.]
MNLNYKELYEKYKILEDENKKLRDEVGRLRKILSKEKLEMDTSADFTIVKETGLDYNDNLVTMNSASKEKIQLFMSLFKGRADVCAKRWKSKPGYSPYCFNDFRPGICNKPKIKCSDCKYDDFAPLDEERIEGHLLGKYVLGLYPMTLNDTCFLLVMDFDESTWSKDVKIVMKICYEMNIPVYAERSRSGNGCHLWLFFEKEIKASLARKFGTIILNISMEESENIKFNSYDRLFPSQDFLQKDGFGNLIALPLQKQTREQGNSIFVDKNLKQIDDQWRYLSQIQKISEEHVLRFCNINKVIDAGIDTETSKVDNRYISISKTDFPDVVILEKCRGIKISKNGLSSKGLLLLRKLASYANPEFYSKQAMRQSTYGVPRVTVVYDEDDESIILPRGIESELLNLFGRNNIKYIINDNRYECKQLQIKFDGQLDSRQEEAFQELNCYNEGVLSATTGFGKTVIGARVIAEKSCPTLVLVHTKELARQWKERLEQFLQIDEVEEKRTKKKSAIGQLGGGKKELFGIVDIVIMQSMFEKDKSVKQIINQYGLIIVDECHHISATNFSRIISSSAAKYIYGLTATPIRKDGHHPIIFMHCGPIRHKVNAKHEALLREFEHYIIPRFTSTRMPIFKKHDEWHITEVYKHICESNYRNELIVDDIIESINAGRNPLVLTERTSHINQLVQLMVGMDFEVIVLSGNLKTKERKKSLKKIESLKDGDRFVIVATGKLIGEGFDEARLDTLFMTMPIAWKGTIAQYAGRLHRNYKGKNEVLIYDYVDVHIPVLERMYHKRLTAYRSVGYSIKDGDSEEAIASTIYDEANYLEYLIQDIKLAKENILISSPYLQKKKIDEIKEVLIERYRSGIRVTLCIKTLGEYENKHNNQFIVGFINEMKKEGIDIIQIPNNHLKFTVVDNVVVWYGDINILGRSYNDSSLIRIKDEVLANELIGEITEP